MTSCSANSTSGTSGSMREIPDITECYPCSRSTVLPMSPVAQRPTCRGCLAPLRKAAEPRRVMLEDMGDDVQVVGRERGLDVAAGRDIGHAEVDLALPGTRGLDQHDLGVVGPPRPRAGQ